MTAQHILNCYWFMQTFSYNAHVRKYFKCIAFLVKLSKLCIYLF